MGVCLENPECPDRRRARRTASARLEVGMQSVHHGRSGPVGRGIGDGASDEGFRGVK